MRAREGECVGSAVPLDVYLTSPQYAESDNINYHVGFVLLNKLWEQLLITRYGIGNCVKSLAFYRRLWNCRRICCSLSILWLSQSNQSAKLL